MKGDFTRKTFRKKKHYNKVNMQQGRVQLDADWNEQIDILTYQRNSALKDMIGPSGVPFSSQKYGNNSFKIETDQENNYEILRGHIYVDGILCENENDILASEQEDLPVFGTHLNDILPSKNGYYLVYLEVWERHLTCLDDAEILEPALGGPDTATRTKVVWQVKIKYLENYNSQERTCGKVDCPSHEIIESGKMLARSRKIEPSVNVCELSPEAGYQRLSNQLYRVEIHGSGELGESNQSPPTFKWSRDNGSIVAKVKRFSDDKIIIPSMKKDRELSFSPNDWIEIIDDRRELWNEPGIFVKLIDINEVSDVGETELKFDTQKIDGDQLTKNFPIEFNPKVRRWDGKKGFEEIPVPESNEDYFELEDGVEIKFEKDKFYRTSDYWLIPARRAVGQTEKGDILWPQENDGPKPLPPDGIKRHFSSLAIINYDGNEVTVESDCRKFFPDATNLPLIYYNGGDGQEGPKGKILPCSLKVGVAIKAQQVKSEKLDLKVHFEIVEGNGKLLSTENTNEFDELDITVKKPLVECRWKLGDKTYNQLVKAFLLDDSNNQLCSSLFFNARIAETSQKTPQLANTGIIILRGNIESNTSIGPFYHYLENINSAPAILLGNAKKKIPRDIGPNKQIYSLGTKLFFNAISNRALESSNIDILDPNRNYLSVPIKKWTEKSSGDLPLFFQKSEEWELKVPGIYKWSWTYKSIPITSGEFNVVEKNSHLTTFNECFPRYGKSEDKIELSGNAPPGSRVYLFWDNKPKMDSGVGGNIAYTKTNESGIFKFDFKVPIKLNKNKNRCYLWIKCISSQPYIGQIIEINSYGPFWIIKELKDSDCASMESNFKVTYIDTEQFYIMMVEQSFHGEEDVVLRWWAIPANEVPDIQYFPDN